MKRYQLIKDKNYFSNTNKLAQEIREIIKDGWGDWDIKYIHSHILTSKFLVFALDKDEIIGFGSANEIPYKNEVIYYLEFTAIKRKHQGNKLSMILNKEIFKEIVISNLKKMKFNFQVMTISPNPRVLGTILRTADYVYPNPNNNQEAPEAIWNKVKYLVKYIGDPYKTLEKKYGVISGFYENTPELIYDYKSVPKDKDKKINEFANKVLKYDGKKGREFVIYAKYSLFSFVKSFFRRGI